MRCGIQLQDPSLNKLLEAKKKHFEAKIDRCEAKIYNLETKIDHSTAKIDDFETKINHLEASLKLNSTFGS